MRGIAEICCAIVSRRIVVLARIIGLARLMPLNAHRNPGTPTAKRSRVSQARSHPPARQLSASQRNKWPRTTRGPSGHPNIRGPSSARCSIKNPRPHKHEKTKPMTIWRALLLGDWANAAGLLRSVGYRLCHPLAPPVAPPPPSQARIWFYRLWDQAWLQCVSVNRHHCLPGGQAACSRTLKYRVGNLAHHQAL
jgi:hypothetical protein